MRYVSGTKLDERIVRCDLDLGYKEGRQFGRGKSGGQASLLLHFFHISQSYPFYLFSRFATNIGKITMRDVEDGVLKRRDWKLKGDENVNSYTLTLAKAAEELPVEERTGIKVSYFVPGLVRMY